MQTARHYEWSLGPTDLSDDIFQTRSYVYTVNKGIFRLFIFIAVVQSLSRVRLFVTPWTAACRPPCPSPSPGVYSNSCPPSQWCHPTVSFSVIPFSSSLQSFPASGSFLMKLLYIRWLKYWSFSFSISPSNEYSGWISFRMNWLDLLAGQGTLKSLQRNSLKASILWCSTFFTDLLVYLYKKYQVAR